MMDPSYLWTDLSVSIPALRDIVQTRALLKRSLRTKGTPLLGSYQTTDQPSAAC